MNDLATAETAAERAERIAARTRRPVPPPVIAPATEQPSIAHCHPDFTPDLAIAHCPTCRRSKYAPRDLWNRGRPICKSCGTAMEKIPPD